MDDKQVIGRYLHLMSEVKRRIDAIHMCLHDETTDPWFLYETCFLHFRMICELIALACLVAHDDIPNTRSQWFRKSIDVPAMMKALAQLHRDFYPRPGVLIINSRGEKELVPIATDYLTKQDLSHLHSQAGGILHRGSFKKVFEKPSFSVRKRDDVVLWCHKIMCLLAHHQITLVEEGTQLWVDMEVGPERHVQVSVMVAKRKA